MPPAMCSGYQKGRQKMLCCFSTASVGSRAQGKFDGKCVWCNPVELARRCADTRLRKLMVFNLVTLRSMDVSVFHAATKRLPLEWRGALGEEAQGRAGVAQLPTPQALPPGPAQEAPDAPTPIPPRRRPGRAAPGTPPLPKVFS